MRKAIVAGATGLIGSYLTQFLSISKAYDQVYALVRKSGSINLPGVQEIVVDYNHLNFVNLEVDDVFCALGTTIKTAGSQEKFYQVDHDFVITLAKSTVELGASRFLMVSSIGANEKSGNFYLKVKGETERDLKAHNFPVTLIFRPSLLLGPRKERRPLEKFGEVMLKLMKPILVGDLKKNRPVHAAQVALCMIDQALNSEDGTSKIIDSNTIRSYQLPNDI